MKYFYYALLFFLLPLFTKAQSNYKPGYVVSLNGDTVKGYVNYREWDKNPDKIDFKNTLDAQAAEYTVDNAIGFGLSGLDYYERHTILISQDVVGNTKDIGLDTTKLQKTVFLQLLTGGKVNLFRYKDNIKTRYYISDASSPAPVELIYHNYRSTENVTTLVTSMHYRVQLNTLAIKYGETDEGVQKRISNARYAASDLVKIVQLLNGTSAKKLTSGSNFGVRFFAGAGINYDDLNITGFKAFESDQTNISNTPLPRIQAGIDIFANKYTKRIGFRTEISYTGGKHSITAPVKGPADVTGTADLDYTQTVFSIAPQIIISLYNTDNFKLNLLGGFTYNFFSYSKYVYKVTHNDPYYDYTIPDEPRFVKSGLFITGKIAATFKKFEVFAGMAPRVAQTDISAYSFSHKAYQAGFNWYF